MRWIALWALVGCGPKLGAPDVSYGIAEPMPLVQTSVDRHRWYVVIDTGTYGERLFFLDSGYARSTCDDAFATELGLKQRGHVFVHGVGGFVLAKKARLPSLTAGGHRLDKFACIVRDLNTTSSIRDPQEVQIAGVIGADLLSRFVTTIDPVTGWLHLTQPSTTEPLPDSSQVVRLKRTGPGGTRFQVQASVEGTAGWWLLDTGARGSHLDGSSYDIEPTSVQQDTWIHGTGSHGGTQRDLHFFDHTTVVLAEHAVSELRLVQRTHGPFGFDLLGLNVLANFRITLDPEREAVRFEPVRGQSLLQWTTWRQAQDATRP